MKRKKNFSEKPYNRCLFCPKRMSDPRECNGPRTGSMTTDRWREYMRDIKEVDGLTFDEIAERTNGQMSAASIQNALAPGATRDLNRETARIIENAMFGGAVADPCPFEFLGSLPDDTKKAAALETEMEKLRSNISAIHDFYNLELSTVRGECQRKLDYLKEENQRLREQMDRKDEYIDRLAKKAGI